MSGRSGGQTLEEDKPKEKSLADQIREIMGGKQKKAAKGGTRDKEAKKLLAAQLKLLEPYCGSLKLGDTFSAKVKEAQQLGWVNSERENFIAKLKQLEKNIGDMSTYAVAADKIDEALAVARTNDTYGSMRQDATELLGETVSSMSPLKDYLRTKRDEIVSDQVRDFDSRIAQLRQDLQSDKRLPSMVHHDCLMLADEIERALADLPTGPSQEEQTGTRPPAFSEAVEKVRNSLVADFTKVRDEELVPCRKAVTQGLKKGDLQKPEQAADNTVNEYFAKHFAILANVNDRKEMPTWDKATDEERVENLKARAATATNALRKDCKDFRDNFAQNAQKFLQDSKGKEAQSSGENLQKAKAKFEQDYQQIETALAQLADMGCAEVKALRADCEDMKTKVIDASAYSGADALIKLKLQILETAKNRTAGQAKQEADRLALEIGKLTKELKEFHGRLDSLAQNAYKTLCDEADQLSAVLKTGNIAAFKAVEVQIAKLRATGLGAGGDAIVKLVVDARAIKETAAKKEIAKEYSSEANEMLLAVKTIFDNLDIYELKKARQELDAITVEATKLTESLLELGKWREDVKARLVPVTENRKKLQKWCKEQKNKNDQRETTFDIDFRTVRDGYDKPGVDTAEMTKLLVGLETSLPPIIAGLEKQRGGEFNKAVQKVLGEQKAAQDNKDKAKQEIADAKKAAEDAQKRLDAYNKLWSQTESRVNRAQNGDKDELKELKVLGDQVKDKLKTKDVEGAVKQLDSIEKRLKDLFDAPGGVTASSMAVLGNIRNNWETALSKTLMNVDSITEKASKVARDLSLDGNALVVRANGLKRKISGYNFTDAVLALASENTPLGTRKKERENALKLVRSLRTLLEADPEALKFNVNPFGVKKPFGNMHVFLNELEYNALRAVPPE